VVSEEKLNEKGAETPHVTNSQEGDEETTEHLTLETPQLPTTPETEDLENISHTPKNDNAEERGVVGGKVNDRLDGEVGGDGEVYGEADVSAGTGNDTVQTYDQPLTELGNTSWDSLVTQTKEDVTLASLRVLADKEAEGFAWEDELLFKHQLDQFGGPTKRLCVPLPSRGRCLMVAHDKFGHSGKNKVGRDVARALYWPSLWKDVGIHCRACTTCQRFSKAKPRHNPMVEREIVSIPSEKVAIDVVGPLPKVKGGCEYILTCIDMATRWPEAVALKKATAAIIVRNLVQFFSRNGFPGGIISDNWPQFFSQTFDTFCRKNGINHIRTSVYCPESNGIVERFHGTLKRMVAKCVEAKGSWPDILPMCLFFIRLTPNAASGFSPFFLAHGWEPNTPSQVL